MAGILDVTAHEPPGEKGAGFDHWLIQRSFSMLAPMCRIGLIVVALMLLVIDPVLYRSGVWGSSPQHAYLIAWHACAAAYFLAFLIASRSGSSHEMRQRCLLLFLSLGALLFPWFAFISWMLSGDLSTYAIYLLTMVCVFCFPGRLRKMLNLASTATLVLVINWFDGRSTFYTSGAAINLVALAAVALLLDAHLMRLNQALYREKCRVEFERARADKVLYNALPMSIANELKNNNAVKAEKYQRMTVLFVDIVGFTRFSAGRSPDTVVQVLNDIFSEFDTLVDRYDVEKIKTIGDAYMVIGKGNVAAVANLALDMLAAMTTYRANHGYALDIRAGMHVGPTVAGVIGLKRFLYDVWGDAVNTASRMESTGRSGMIQVSEEVRLELLDDFCFQSRGSIDVKGKGLMHTCFLLGPQPLAPRGHAMDSPAQTPADDQRVAA